MSTNVTQVASPSVSPTVATGLPPVAVNTAAAGPTAPAATTVTQVDPAMIAMFQEFMKQQQANAQQQQAATQAQAAPAETAPVNPLEAQIEAFLKAMQPHAESLFNTITKIGNKVVEDTLGQQIKQQEAGIQSNTAFLNTSGIVKDAVDGLGQLVQTAKANLGLLTDLLARGMEAAKAMFNSPQISLMNFPFTLLSAFDPSAALNSMNAVTRPTVNPAPTAAVAPSVVNTVTPTTAPMTVNTSGI